jgi:uncharacterized protein (TIGR03067 family)
MFDRLFRWIVIMVLIVVCCTGEHRCEGDEPESPLIGEWIVIGMKRGGQPAPEASYRDTKWVFDKNKYKMTRGSTTPAGQGRQPSLQGPYSLADDESPKHFSFAMVNGDTRLDVEGIYRIEKGELELCFGNGMRATTFDTTGTKNLCYRLKRVEPLPDKKPKPTKEDDTE